MNISAIVLAKNNELTISIKDQNENKSKIYRIVTLNRSKGDTCKNQIFLQMKKEGLLKNYDSEEIYEKVIGNTLDPRFIFVGERRNDRQNYRDVSQPFDFGPSSRFLFEKIKEAKIDFKKCAFLNSDFPGFVNFVVLTGNSRTKIIALGKVADKNLTIAGVKHEKLNHPQFENRFQHGKDIFLKELKRITKK
jgi:hypothetical protein